MSAITFDTLKYIKTLESVGIPRAQAEAFAEATASLRVEANGFATREEVLQHEKEISIIQRDIAEIKATMVDMKTTMVTKTEMKAELRDLELRLTIRLGAMMAASVGLTTALIKLL